MLALVSHDGSICFAVSCPSSHLHSTLAKAPRVYPLTRTGCAPREHLQLEPKGLVDLPGLGSRLPRACSIAIKVHLSHSNRNKDEHSLVLNLSLISPVPHLPFIHPLTNKLHHHLPFDSLPPVERLTQRFPNCRHILSRSSLLCPPNPANTRILRRPKVQALLSPLSPCFLSLLCA